MIKKAGVKRLADAVRAVYGGGEEESDCPVHPASKTTLNGCLSRIAALRIPAYLGPDSCELDYQAVINQHLQGFPDRTPVDSMLLPDFSLGGEQLAILVGSGDNFCFNRVVHNLVE
jgi:hypothetical protein